MSHIFISYSHDDSTYALKLARDLESHDFVVWIDERIPYGDAWFDEITRAIKSSAAVTVIMTPHSEASQFVKKEILIAQKYRKPIIPLLAEGQEFDLLIDMHYVDVRDYRMPPKKYYERLREHIPAPAAPSTTPLDPETIENILKEYKPGMTMLESDALEPRGGMIYKRGQITSALRDIIDRHHSNRAMLTRRVGSVTVQIQVLFEFSYARVDTAPALQAQISFFREPLPTIQAWLHEHEWQKSKVETAGIVKMESYFRSWALATLDDATLNNIADELIEINREAGTPPEQIIISGGSASD